MHRAGIHFDRDRERAVSGDRERAIRNVCRLYTVNRVDALPGAIRTAIRALLDETVPIM